MHCLFENTVFLAHIGRSGLQKGPGKQGEGPKKHHDKEAALKETLRGFKMILNGECDSIPESCFLFAGTIDDVFAKAGKQ